MADDSNTSTPAAALKALSGEPSDKPAEKPVVTWVIPLITAVTLAAVFGIYYFVYAGARQEYLINRNFRDLAMLGDQLQNLISIHGSILEFYADLANPERNPNPRHRSKEDLSQFLVVRPEDEKKHDKADEARSDYLKYLAPNFELDKTPKPFDSTKSAPSRLRLQRRNGRWELVLTARDRKKNLDYRGTLRLDDLLKPLVEGLPFDDVLLASEQGTIVYQFHKAGAEFTTLTDLLKAQIAGLESKPAISPAATPTAVGRPAAASGSDNDERDGSRAPVHQNTDQAWRTSMHWTDLKLGGTRYKLFAQPILVDASTDSSSDPSALEEPAREWVLCGLKSAAALQWEALSISYTFIIWFVALFVAVCLSGPLLKLVFMNQRERFRLRELGFLGLFLLLIAGVFTLSGLQAAYVPASDDTEERLQTVGDRLAINIRNELRRMRDQLTAWCASPELRHDLKDAEDREVIRSGKPEGGTLAKRPIGRTPTPDQYPYLNNAFWTDDDGHQIVKWSVGGYVTPMIDVSQLAIFNSLKSTYLDGKPPPLHFDSILPPNKLEYLAAVTMNTCDCNPGLCPVSGGTIRRDVTGGSAFLTGQPLSLIDPILPYGYGFALVDQTGLVLFHSDKTRNLRENFRQESDWSKELYAATFGHSTQHSLPVKYMGRDYRARVVPIPDVAQAPWSLIVYRDLSFVRTDNLQATAMASTLFLWFLSGPALLVGIWCAVHRPRFAPEWLWPHERRMGTYLAQIPLYTLLIILFLFLGFQGSAEQIGIVCAALPYVVLLLTVWCARSSAARQRTWRPRNTLAASATLGVIFVLSLLLWAWQLTGAKPAAQTRWSALTALAAIGVIATAPLLDRPRQYLRGRLHQWRPTDGLAKPYFSLSQQGPFTHWYGYVLSVLLLLILIGVLMPMALFRASLGVERRLALKQAQLHLASALAERRALIEEQCDDGNLSDTACDALKDRASPAWRSIVFDRPPAGSETLFVPHADSPRESREFYSSWFRRLVYLLHHDYNNAAAETLGMIPDRVGPRPGGGSADWSWTEGDHTISLRWHGVHPSQDSPLEDDVLITWPAPVDTGRELLAGVVVAVVVILAVGGLLWALARKLFLFDVTPLKMTGARQLAEALRDRRSVLVLLPPVSRSWQLEGPKWTCNVPDLASGPRWAEFLNLDTIPSNTVIEIQHFEYGATDAEMGFQKLIFLERLMQREGTQVAAVMTVAPGPEDYRRMFPALEVIDLREEPFYWLREYEGPARDLIWKECGPMAALWPIGAQLARDIKDEPIHSEDTVASEILERADPYYRLIWKEGSKEQKFVLAQLAEDGLLNPTNGRAIRQMVRRGLITKDPQFRIMNESFRRFLRSAATADLKREWLRESRRSGWGKARGVFATTMIILGVFLLTTQNALWQSSAAYVTTALGALGTLVKLFNTVRGGGSGASPKTS